jgi:hypothetical protein
MAKEKAKIFLKVGHREAMAYETGNTLESFKNRNGSSH